MMTPYNKYGISVDIETITPKDAVNILERFNPENRKVSQDRINTYVRDIKSGNWSFNGDVIRFDQNGMLIDGQHRLTAVAKSGVSIDFLVVRGIESITKVTIDTGKSRTGGDALSIESGVGSNDSHVMNGALTHYELYRKNGGIGSYSGSQRLVNREILESYDKNKQLITRSLEWMHNNVTLKGLLITKVEILFIHMVLSELNEREAGEFLKKILTGTGLEAGDTELHLRDILIERKMKTRNMNKITGINTIFKCWNSVRRGNRIKHKGSCVWNQRDGVVIAK